MGHSEPPATPVLEIESRSPADTRALGLALGRLVQPGDVILLQGDLGAGKTTLTQGLAAGAGTTEVVNSPTFILMNEYHGRLPIYHADLYRLDSAEEVLALDLPGVSLDGALVVEWPERGDGLLPEDHLLVRLEHVTAEQRRLRVLPRGRRALALFDRLRAELSRG